MIIGYLPKTGDKCMDYIATIYPEGIINENIIMGVNHKDIMLVITPGYCNKQFEKYNKDLIKIGEQYENAQ